MACKSDPSRILGNDGTLLQIVVRKGLGENESGVHGCITLPLD